MKDVLVTNIQRFSLHDGPGIRTTVFLKGCLLHCPWCHNPENIKFIEEDFIDKDGSYGVYGKVMSEDELYHAIMRDECFYRENGGVTFSGGEPLLSFLNIESLLNRLKRSNVDICVETSLFVPKDNIVISIKYVDLYYVDIKILDHDRCKDVLGGDLNVYYSNLDLLKKANKKIIYRIPMITDYTITEDNINNIVELLKKNKDIKVQLIIGHNIAAEKYKSLGLEVPHVNDISERQLSLIIKRIIDLGVEVEVCKV